MRPRVDLDRVIRPLRVVEGEGRRRLTPSARRRAAVERADAIRDIMLDRGRVLFLQSFPLVTFPYPTRYGLRDALSLPLPYLALTNRVFIVQVASAAGVVTVLVSPSDADRNAETPFFKGLLDGAGRAAPLVERAVTRRHTTVLAALARCGLAPEDVDFITYDHLHTQDLRGWLGDRHADTPEGRQGLLPRARLIAMREEWATVEGPSAPQRPWYCPDGIRGVAMDRVVLIDGDVTIGEGLALVRTPGHTEGNHSIVTATDEGLFVTSENGICPDAYAPEASRIPGLAAYARRGMDVVLNGNTLERGLEQYFSMVFEKRLAGVSARDPRFPNTLASSELTPAWYAPGLQPTFTVGDVCYGRAESLHAHPWTKPCRTS